MTAGLEVIGGGVIVASGAIAGATWKFRGRRTGMPWSVDHDGVAWQATNCTGETTLELRIRIDDVDVRGIGIHEEIDVAPNGAATFSADPGAAPTISDDARPVDGRSARDLPAVELSWKYEVGGRRYYFSTHAEQNRTYYWSRGPGGQWG